MLDCLEIRARGLSDFLAAQHPSIVGTPLEPILEPRRIQAPTGYHSTKCVSVGMYLLLVQSRIKDELNLQQVPTEITAHSIAYGVINHGLHVLYVREQFAEAVAATDLPHDFTLDDLHWPMPGLVIGWPAGFMQEAVGRDLCFVYAANMDAGDYSVAAMPGCPTITVPQAKVGWHYYAWDGQHLESFVSAFHRDNPVDEAILNYGYTDYTGIRDEAGVEADKAMTDRVSALMLKLLVVLNTRPNLVERGHCVRPQRLKRGRVKHRELWSPNLIGWRYQVKRSGTQIHASPRLHWRRGHLRNQPFGPGRRQRRLVWIEPVLVGASGDA